MTDGIAMSTRREQSVRETYRAQDGYVWKNPVEQPGPGNSRVITIGFRVCKMCDEVGPEAAETVAALMNAGDATFQERVRPWLLACFGEMIAGDREERSHRFPEEALELVQACGCSASEAHQLVDYVYGRPAGEKGQEVGGVMVTLAALCLAQALDMHGEAETELARIWTKVEQIRAKQAAKPKYSPLPEAVHGLR